MSVTQPHPAYLETFSTWQALRHAYQGSGAVKTARGSAGSLSASRGVKEAGAQYLPRPSGMRRQAQYDAYRARAIWYGATERAVHGLTGAVMRRPPQITAPDRLTPHLSDITLVGIPLASFAEQALRETLLMGRYGVMVDFPKPEKDTDGNDTPPPVTSRPYWVGYVAEDILNWRTVQRQGQTVLSLVVLREYLQEPLGVYPSPDFFTVTPRTQYRVLRLNEDGVYDVSVWREVVGGVQAAGQATPVALHAAWVPRREGVPLEFIPFCVLAPFSLEPNIEKSLLEALVEVNFQYYRHSADYEHGLHLTALPTPYIIGYQPEGTTLEIGGSSAWMIPNADATVGMLEFQGQGLQSHERAMAADIQNMAALGARLLEGQPLVAETATAVMNRTHGTQSPVQSLTTTLSLGLSRALQWHAWWAGMVETPQDPGVLVTLNTDLVSAQLDPSMLRELVAAWLSGAMSFDTLYANLKRGEIIRPGIEADEEQGLIDVEQAARGMGGLLDVAPLRNGAGG